MLLLPPCPTDIHTNRGQGGWDMVGRHTGQHLLLPGGGCWLLFPLRVPLQFILLTRVISENIHVTSFLPTSMDSFSNSE